MRILRMWDRVRPLRGGTAAPGRRKPLRSFVRDTGGAVALIFGLTVIPLLGFAGGAIDYANAYRMRSKLQDALDTATLTAGREIDMGRSVGEAKATANNVLSANLGEGTPTYTSTLSIDARAGTVLATANMRVDTYILGVIGQDHFDVAVESTVRLPQGKVEVAMVLDNSGSMAGSKIRELQDAAKRLTQILFQSSRGEDWVKIGLVPFAGSVNVGSGNANKLWMDTEGRSSAHYENFDINASSGLTRFSLFNQMRNTSWAGCVEVRPSPFDVNDVSPTPDEKDSYFVPMFAPDEPDGGSWFSSYPNNYLDDDEGDCPRAPRNQTDMQAQEKTCKYNRERPSGGSGPNHLCDSQQIQELTNTQGRVIGAIESMRANGLTNIHEGVMWGWRVLSPGEPFTEGRAYDARDNSKVMIVMTDGENTHGGRNNENMSEYTAYGYAKNGRLRAPTNNTGRLQDAMDEKTAAACSNAKAQGIVVYTIAVGVRNQGTLRMLEQCATSTSRAFSIDDGDALTAVFEAIAGEINKLRIAS